MKEVPETLNAGKVPFPTTHWSAITAGLHEDASSEAAREGLAQLCRDYWPPIYSFVRRAGHSTHDAQDITQGFFIYLLENKVYARADRSRGKFRSFLLGTLKHYLSSTREHEGRLKRGGGIQFLELDQKLGAIEALCAANGAYGLPADEERAFEWSWAQAIVGRAIGTLRQEYADDAKARIYEELSVFLRGGNGLPTQEEAALRLGIPVATLRSHLSRLRARYREALRAEVVRTVADPADVDEELLYLCRVLVAGS